MVLLSKDFVNARTSESLKLKEDLNIDLIINILAMNSQYFKKVAIVKEYLLSLADYIDISKCENINQLKRLKYYTEKNMRMLVNG